MYIKDKVTGKVKLYGEDHHDSLAISDDGKYLYYENLQNGDGSLGGYVFCDKEGRTPNEDETLAEYGADAYFNIGGFHELKEDVDIVINTYDILDAFGIKATIGNKYLHNKEEIIDTIKSCLAITRKDTVWIPVSKRMPKVMAGTKGECSDDVLIYVVDDEGVCTISTGFYGYYPNDISSQGWWCVWIDGCHQLDSKYKVVAWMPLPESYKTEREVENDK